MANNAKPKYKHPIRCTANEKGKPATEHDIHIITENEFESAAGVNGDDIGGFSWNGLQITTRPALTLHEVSEFVNSVFGSCYDAEHDVLMPEVIDFAIRVNTVLRYSNVRLPADTEKQYMLMYRSGFYEELVKHICSAQVEAVRETVRLLYENMCRGRDNTEL